MRLRDFRIVLGSCCETIAKLIYIELLSGLFETSIHSLAKIERNIHIDIISLRMIEDDCRL